jgi:prepilin-type N-terminal cleavage/methylation domain-containing protein
MEPRQELRRDGDAAEVEVLTHRARPRVDHRRGGFTLIELMVAASIVGILAGLAIPNLRTMIYRARATEVAADLEVVRVAALSYNANENGWPSEASAGAVPTGMETYLPDGFSLDGNGYQLDYENWALPGGLPGDPNTTALIGVSVTATEDDLGNAIAEFLGGSIVFSVGNTHTIVIDRS